MPSAEDRIAELVEQRFKELRENLRATGTVTGTSGTKVIVTVRGQSMTLPRYAHYTPVNGDVVIVDTAKENSWMVLGKPAV
jgi:hypothetical protein